MLRCVSFLRGQVVVWGRVLCIDYPAFSLKALNPKHTLSLEPNAQSPKHKHKTQPHTTTSSVFLRNEHLEVAYIPGQLELLCLGPSMALITGGRGDR